MVVLLDTAKASVFRKEMIVSHVSFWGEKSIQNMSSFTTCHHQTGKKMFKPMSDVDQ